MNLYCDNYAQCNALVLDRGGEQSTEAVARAKGWHIFHGETMGGVPSHVYLCDGCSGSRRRALRPAPGPTPGQLELELDSD